MKIRRANENDITSIKFLIDTNFDDVISKFHSHEIVSKFKDHNSIESLKSQLNWKKIYVAVDDEGKIVGTGSFVDFGTKDVPKYSVSNLYVLPNLHNKGIGSQIVDALQSDAKECSAASFHVPSTRNGVPFYEHCGFSNDKTQADIEDEITWMTKIL